MYCKPSTFVEQVAAGHYVLVSQRGESGMLLMVSQATCCDFFSPPDVQLMVAESVLWQLVVVLLS